MTTEVNKDQVTSVVQYPFRPFKNMVYREREVKKSFFGLFKKVIEEGCYYTYASFSQWFPKKGFDYTVMDKKAYLKPKIKIEMSSGKYKHKIFETEEEMFNWREKNLKGIKLIEL